MAARLLVFAAALGILGGGYAAPCEPCDPAPVIGVDVVPGTAIEEVVLPCAPPVMVSPPPVIAPCPPTVVTGPCYQSINPPCDADGQPMPMPTPLSFPIPVPPPLPSSSVFALLSQAQNGDPSAVLSQISKVLASTLPCPHLQAAAAAAPPPQAPCDAPVVAPPCNAPAIPVPAPPCNTPTMPAPVAPPCNTPVIPAPVSPPCKPPSGPIVQIPTIQTPVSYLGPPSTLIAPVSPKVEPVVSIPPAAVENVAAGCGQPLDSASLVTLAALQQQANLGLTSLPSDLGANQGPAPCFDDAIAANFDFPTFGHATSHFFHPWSRVYEPLRRLYRPNF